MNKKFPFILINDQNVTKVKASSLRSLIIENNFYCMNKKTLLSRYNDLYGITLTESQSLLLAKNICEYNGLIFDREQWRHAYNKWIALGKSYSIRFF